MIGRKPVIGLAGGIGAGKSTVGAEFARLGCLLIDGDRQSHEVLQQPDVADQVRRLLGAPDLDVSGPEGRRRIGKLLFGRPELVEKMNGLIHPRVKRMRREAIERANGDPAIVAVVLDTPLLFEAGVDRECDATVFVEAAEERRLARVAAGRGWSADELAARQRYQLDLAVKRARCDHVIRNDGPAEELAGQVKEILGRVLKKAERGPRRGDSK